MGSRKLKKSSSVEPWVYQGRPLVELKDFPEGTYGFIYEITHKETGQKYIGKKQLLSYHKKATKVFNEKTKRWNKIYEVTSTESNWQKYFGSNKEIVDLVKKEGKENFERRILHCCRSKKELTYREMQYQVLNSVLEDSRYINSNILGKFFRADFK